MSSDEPAANTLGLAFDKLKIEQPAEPAGSPNDDGQPAAQEKTKPYVNPERVNTGGPKRDKLTEDELTERMARIKEQNEKIKQRRLDVAADEAAFKKMQEAERAKIALSKKVQENVNRTRDQNAKRKLDNIQSREWDSGKPTGDWKSSAPPAELSPTQAEQPPSTADESPSMDGQWQRGNQRGRSHRGGGRGRSRGRGRGGPSSQSVPAESNPEPASDPVNTL